MSSLHDSRSHHPCASSSRSTPPERAAPQRNPAHPNHDLTKPRRHHAPFLHSLLPPPSRTQPIQDIPAVAIAAERALDVLAPAGLGVQPIAAQPQPDARIARLHLRALHGDQLVEVLVQAGRLARAAAFVVMTTAVVIVVAGRRWRRRRRTMPCGIVLVSNVAEEPDLVLADKQREAEGVDGRVAVALVEEAAALVEMLEELSVRLPPPERQRPDLEVAEELAVVVLHAVVRVEQPIEIGVRVDQLGIFGDEIPRHAPQAREAARVVEDCHVEAVHQVVLGEEAERVVGHVAEEVHVRLDPPVPVVGCQGRVLVEEPGLPPDHRVVAEHVAFAHPDRPQVVQAVHVPRARDPGRRGPVRAWDEVVFCARRGRVGGCCLHRREGGLVSDRNIEV